jgi:hypothetical protein
VQWQVVEKSVIPELVESYRRVRHKQQRKSFQHQRDVLTATAMHNATRPVRSRRSHIRMSHSTIETHMYTIRPYVYSKRCDIAVLVNIPTL